MRVGKHNKPKHKSCVSNLDLGAGRDCGCVLWRAAAASCLCCIQSCLSPAPPTRCPCVCPTSQFLLVHGEGGKLHRAMWESAQASAAQSQHHGAMAALSFQPVLCFLHQPLGTDLTGEGRGGVLRGCCKAGGCRGASHPSQLWKARPCCIWDLFICCEGFLWRDNAKRISINRRAKARMSWPSSSMRVLAPSQQLSHKPSLQIMLSPLEACPCPMSECTASPAVGRLSPTSMSPAPR